MGLFVCCFCLGCVVWMWLLLLWCLVGLQVLFVGLVVGVCFVCVVLVVVCFWMLSFGVGYVGFVMVVLFGGHSLCFIGITRLLVGGFVLVCLFCLFGVCLFCLICWCRLLVVRLL